MIESVSPELHRHYITCEILSDQLLMLKLFNLGIESKLGSRMAQDTLARAKITVDGIVQGVGFRYSVRFIARKYNLVGYAKNLEDGAVEIVCEGTRSSMDSFVEEIKGIEEPVRVERLDVTFEEPKKEFGNFRIVTGELAEEMVEGFSTGMMHLNCFRQETRESFKSLGESLGRKVDAVGEKVDSLGEKIDAVGESIISEIRALREDLRAFMDERLKKIESDISAIKSKLGML